LNFFLIYKGHYGTSLKGPEMRYVGLAKSLVSAGHSVSLAARSFDTNLYSPKLNFVAVHNMYKMFVTMLKSDVMVLHGGGPFILISAILVSFLGKKIVLDGYVPHWIELDEVAHKTKSSFVLSAKSAFNAFRSLLAVFVFDLIIVANNRQLDLMRGFAGAFTRTREFSKIQIIPFGCEPYELRSRVEGLALLNSINEKSPVLNESDFLVGWLGGTYGWFDLNSVVAALSDAFAQNQQIKLVFFGVSEENQVMLLSNLPESLQSQIVFLPWVPFMERFKYWAAFDISLVWGGQGYENDYASRTRNFDCLSLGLPIIQNEDDEWGRRLEKHGAGIVTTQQRLSTDLLHISQDSKALELLKNNMVQLAPEFYWDEFAKTLINSVQRVKTGGIRRLFGVLALLTLLPALLLFFVYELVNQRSVREKS